MMLPFHVFVIFSDKKMFVDTREWVYLKEVEFMQTFQAINFRGVRIRILTGFRSEAGL